MFDRFTVKYRTWPRGQQIWLSASNVSILNHAVEIDIGKLTLMNESMTRALEAVEAECEQVLSRPECDQVFVKLVD